MKNTLARSRAIFFGLAFITLWASPALAQGNTWIGANLARMVDAAGWKLGVMRLNAALEVLNAGYDTDIYYGYREPVPDGTISARLPVQVLWPLGKKAVLDVSERPEYVFYLEAERERAWNHDFQGRFHLALNRVYVQAGAGISSIRQRQASEVFINLREKRNDLSGLLFWQASRQMSFAMAYDWSKFDYGSEEFNGIPLAEMLARRERYLDLVGYVQPSSRVRLLLDAQYGSYSFTDVVSSVRDSRSYGIFGGIEFIPRASEGDGGEGTRGLFRLGYQRLDLLDPAQTDGEGFVGAGNVTFDLTSRTSARVFFFRGREFSIYSGPTFFMRNTIGAGLSRRLSRKLTLSYDGSLGRTAYPETGGAPGTGESYMLHAVSLHLRVSRLTNLTFLASYNRRYRGPTGLSHDRAFLGINLTCGYPGGAMALPVGGLSH
ncbi:MAG TPA: outer membrane beta-barrel protein [Candidatus Aminicenantes bacterium]|nr:outer membrane beta-barrel protein [Candidatus Aminicenantes bacterium]